MSVKNNMLIQKRNDYWKLPLARNRRLNTIAKSLGRYDIWYEEYCSDPENHLCVDLQEAENDNCMADASMILGR